MPRGDKKGHVEGVRQKGREVEKLEQGFFREVGGGVAGV